MTDPVRDAAPGRADAGPACGPGVELGDLPGPIRSDPNPGLLRSALHLAYDAAWVVAVLLASPWLLYRSLRRRGYGRMVLERLGAGLPGRGASGRRRVLVHGVSVGEVKAAAPVVRYLEALEEDLEVVVSSTTDTGIEVARKLFPGRQVVRFPADISPVVRRFLRRVDPASVVLLELEIWPNFLRIANRLGVPVAVVNGRITGRSFDHYRLFRRLLPQLSRISLYCVQSGEYAERFLRLEVPPERVLVTGNLKFDGLEPGRVDPGAELRGRVAALPGQQVLVAGSTHEPEELEVTRAWRRGAPGARLVLVPRHPGRAASVVEALRAEGVQAERLTELREADRAGDPRRPLLVDTIGELEGVYGLADLVFVGGSLVPHGGQNILEPAAQGIPVVTGPSLENFVQEAELLGRAGALVRVPSTDELAATLGGLLEDPERRAAMARAGLEALRSQRRATPLTLSAFCRVCLS